ncbi:MAG: hypothetical protein IKB36_05385 [Clostridia bacterium]|nr:hypothetical protein [Clostridia bacterium]
MKKYLKNNEGMALPMVLIIMAIIMTFTTGLAVLAYNSYVSVRWMSQEKQAYYLARAGVEAASYAYREAVSKASGDTTSDTGRFVQVGENGGDEAIITSSKVYAYYTKSSNANDNTIWDGFAFSLEAASTENPGYFGYFEVQIGNGADLVRTKDETADKGYVETETPVKVFKSVGHIAENNIVRTVYGYITPTETIQGETLYDENGILKRAVGAGAFTKKDEITISYETLDTEVGITGQDGFLTRLAKIARSLFKGLINQVYKQFANLKDGDGNYIFPNFPRNRHIDMYSKISDSTLVLTKPDNSKLIKGGPKLSETVGKDGMQNYGDNFYVISSGENLFLQNVGIDATPEKGQYNSIGLYGDQIIIDGNIILYAYITNPDSLAGSVLTSTISLLGNRFCLGTVMLGHGRVYDENDPKLFKGKGITDENGKDVAANKVYFNGNVVLKLYTQGVGVETYRIFNAGDMAYFYGSFGENTTTNTSAGKIESTSAGIDLLKYFVDAVIEGRDGYHIYGDAVKEKMQKLREIYYGTDSPSYFEGNTVLFKRLEVTTDNKGSVLVNGEKGRIDEIVPPMPSSSVSISWGQPRAWDVFHQ